MHFEKDLASVHAALFLQARTFLLAFEGVQETKKPRITTYSDKNGGICHMRTMAYGIDFGFLKGAQLHDPQKLLAGKGKKLRVLALKKWDETIVRAFVSQAIEINRHGT